MLDVRITQEDLNIGGDYVFWYPNIITRINEKKLKDNIKENCDIIICGFNDDKTNYIPLHHYDQLFKDNMFFPVILSSNMAKYFQSIYTDIFSFLNWRYWIYWANYNDLKIGFIYDSVFTIDLNMENNKNPLLSYYVYRCLNKNEYYNIPNISNIDTVYMDYKIESPLLKRCFEYLNIKHSKDSDVKFTNNDISSFLFNFNFRNNTDVNSIIQINPKDYSMLINGTELDWFNFIVNKEKFNG